MNQRPKFLPRCVDARQPAIRAAGATAACLALLAWAGFAWAATDPGVGAYALTGSGQAQRAYAGRARIERTPEGQFRLTLERGDGASLEGALERRAAGWRFAVDLPGRGITEALDGRAEARRTLRATYVVAADGSLTGKWRVLEGRRPVDWGTEKLVPAVAAPVSGECPTRVHVAVSVDWEGRELAESNLRAMRALRDALPDVPLTHFLNAAYFTKAGADPARVAASIRSVLRPGDETGLHVHAWKSLIDAAGVPFRSEPTFWGYPVTPPAGGGDYGHDVEIAAYPVPDFRAIVRRSRELLSGAGFSLSPSFRAGGWIADTKVLEAIRGEGFEIDSSATDTTWHDELASYPLRGRIAALWPGVTKESAPFWIRTPAGQVLEMPDTGALADYITAPEMEGYLRAALDRCAAERKHDLFVHVGFHQETAERYASRVTEALRAVRALHPPCLVFETLSVCAEKAKETLATGSAGSTGGAGR
ncbi:MAG: hypothetical protein HYZ53_09650 [Planctomycetes bacterium]|nr:hypothetical protein [Planctomycetota bacterium]